MLHTPLSCRPLDVPVEAQKLANEKSFELKAFAFGAAQEQTRAPRLVRIGLVQNQIVCPTTDPILEQVSFKPSTSDCTYIFPVEISHCRASEGAGTCCLSLWSQCPLLPRGLW